MAEDFKRLERTLVRKGKIIDYYQDTVQVPNGNVVKWDFIGHKGAAAMLAVREDGKLLMVRQWRNALDRYTLEIPAGGKNSIDEPTETAAVRELEEETGAVAGDFRSLGELYPSPGYCGEIIRMYLARDLTFGETHLDEDEFLDLERVPFDQLTEQVLSGEIKDAKTIAAVLKGKLLLGL